MATRAGEPSNPDLLRVMHAVALDDSTATRRALYACLLETVLLVPVAGRPGTAGWKTLGESTPYEFIVMRGQAGETGLPVFSDSQALLRWRPAGAPFVGIGARTIVEMARANGFDAMIINPAGPSGGLVTRHELECLASGRDPLAA